MSDLYVVVKLVSGEQIMATLEAEDEKYIMIDYPISIRTTVHPHLDKETVSAAPFCAFSASTSFILDKSHVIFIKQLHPTFVGNYKKFVKIYEEVTFKDSRYYDELDEGEEVELSSMVQGNDTKH